MPYFVYISSFKIPHILLTHIANYDQMNINMSNKIMQMYISYAGACHGHQNQPLIK